jgi:hypothetical protein
MLAVAKRHERVKRRICAAQLQLDPHARSSEGAAVWKDKRPKGMSCVIDGWFRGAQESCTMQSPHQLTAHLCWAGSSHMLHYCALDVIETTLAIRYTLSN